MRLTWTERSTRLARRRGFSVAALSTGRLALWNPLPREPPGRQASRPGATRKPAGTRFGPPHARTSVAPRP